MFLPDTLDADSLNDALGRHAYKDVDEQITASTTFHDDLDLAVAVDANGVYRVLIEGLYQSGTTPDFKQQFTAPSGSSFESSYFLYNPGTVAMLATGALGSVTGLGGTGANVPFMLSATLFVGGTPGTLQWQWAQNTSDAGATIVRKGSRLTAWKMNFSN